MSGPENLLHNLAERWRLGGPDARPRLEAELERTLVPMVRCALRGGVGLSPLVGWVRRQAESLPQGEERSAPRLARLLCGELLRRASPNAAGALETLVGP
jgi:hypothetical protein